ncbi:RhoGAP domain-containing protein [Yersinia proxima]|uniref:RhoGAP domain-containing protein n=2 Tax=Yersinia proxima TaxID=2890316 RepID=UPI000981789D
MLINFLKPINSVSKYISQKKTTQTDLTTAENLLGKKIDKVLNKLQYHARKRNIDILFITTGVRNKSGKAVEISITNSNKVTEALINITSHNTTAKGRAITDEIHTLTNKLNKYIEQNDILNNKKYIAHKSLDILINFVNSTPDFINQEGIFRVPGSQTKVDKLLKIMDEKDYNEINEYLQKKQDINVVCSAIKKQFALQLSNEDKLNIINLAKNHGKDNFSWKSKLPQPLNKLVPLLSSINRNNINNKMSASNLAMNFSPQIIDLGNTLQDDITKEIKKIEFINKFLIDVIEKTPPLVPSRENKPILNKSH